MAPCREDAWDGDGRGCVTMATVSWQRRSEGDALHVYEERRGGGGGTGGEVGVEGNRQGVNGGLLMHLCFISISFYIFCYTSIDFRHYV